jgi:hypothetical protein
VIGVGIFLVTITSKAALEITQLSILWVPEVPAEGVNVAIA